MENRNNVKLVRGPLFLPQSKTLQWKKNILFSGHFSIIINLFCGPKVAELIGMVLIYPHLSVND